MRSIAECALVFAAALATAGCERNRVLSEYGAKTGVSRADDGSVRLRASPHRGVDIKADSIGDPVIASADGMVVDVRHRRGYGTTITIAHHGHARYTTYSHLNDTAVQVGWEVARAQTIGTVGLFKASGQVIHVHWQLCTNRHCRGVGDLGGTEDPMRYADGCYKPRRRYRTDRLVLTLPVPCQDW